MKVCGMEEAGTISIGCDLEQLPNAELTENASPPGHKACIASSKTALFCVTGCSQEQNDKCFPRPVLTREAEYGACLLANES